MKPIEDLRAAHAATTQGEWAAPGFNSQGGSVACLLGSPDGTRLVSGNFLRADAKFIALAHNEFPAMLDEIESLRRKLYAWDSVFGHLGDTPDAIGNLIRDEYDKRDAEIAKRDELLRRAADRLQELTCEETDVSDSLSREIYKFLGDWQ